MKTPQALRALSAVAALLGLVSLLSCATSSKEVSLPPQPRNAATTGLAQVPMWSRQDLDFFLHGSMSTEVVPEKVLGAFIRTYHPSGEPGIRSTQKYWAASLPGGAS